MRQQLRSLLSGRSRPAPSSSCPAPKFHQSQLPLRTQLPPKTKAQPQQEHRNPDTGQSRRSSSDALPKQLRADREPSPGPLASGATVQSPPALHRVMFPLDNGCRLVEPWPRRFGGQFQMEIQNRCCSRCVRRSGSLGQGPTKHLPAYSQRAPRNLDLLILKGSLNYLFESCCSYLGSHVTDKGAHRALRASKVLELVNGPQRGSYLKHQPQSLAIFNHWCLVPG